MRILLLILFLCSQMFAGEEIIVHVATQERLTPVYVAPIKEKGSGFDKSYLASLEKVIRFDFDSNGKTEVASQHNSVYTLELEIAQKIATAKFTSSSSVRTIEGITLLRRSGQRPGDAAQNAQHDFPNSLSHTRDR